MDTVQVRTKLLPTSFVRVLDGIGFIYNIRTRRQEVFDASGAHFLRQFGRTYRSENEVLSSLLQVFSGASSEVLRQDFLEFAIRLHQEGFIELEGLAFPGVSDTGSLPMRTVTADRGIAESSTFLKDYFTSHPTVFSFQFYLTEDCNERCVHCYVARTRRPILPLDRQLEVIDELGAMGTLDVAFTGGEALLRKDLPVLFERATSNDLVISLLSNLTLLTDEMIDLLKAENVEMVQTSLYSMDAAVHDSITRRDGSHRQTLAGLEKLSLAGIPISVGCPVMRQNRDSFMEVVKYGNVNGFPVSCDVAIMAKEDGDTSNLTHRVGASDLEEIIGAVVRNSDKYRDMLEHNRSVVDEVSLDTCGIGNYMLCLKSTGEFLPCPGFGLVVGNAWDSDIADVWMHSPQIIALRQFSRREQFPQCTSCEATTFCNFCLAKFHNEAGWRSGQIPFGYCEIAATNRRVALNYLKRTTP